MIRRLAPWLVYPAISVGSGLIGAVLFRETFMAIGDFLAVLALSFGAPL